MAKTKSRITVSNRPNSMTIRATGAYALQLLAALSGKTPEQTLSDLQMPSEAKSASPESSEKEN